MCRIDTRTSCLRLLATALICLLGVQTLHAEQQFPYVAYVVHTDTYVRSGPGQRYYPTGQLPQGFTVEVYRHDADGWCAVRPPEGSFSWVPAHEVRRVENGLAEVAAEKTVTRVGSTLSVSRSAVQVLLERGERVAVLPAQQGDDSSWLRVKPPAGEFRWIAAGDLGRQAPMELAPATSTTGKWSRVKFRGRPKSQQTSTDNAVSGGVSATGQSSGFDHLVQTSSETGAIASNHSAQVATLDSGHVDIVAGSPAELQLAQFQRNAQTFQAPGLLGQQAPPTANSSPNSSNQATVPRVHLGSSNVGHDATSSANQHERVIELQLRLSQIVSQPPPTWNFEQVTSEANNLLQSTDSAAERGELRDLLDRIARFRRIRAGYTQAPAASMVAVTPTPGVTPPANAITTAEPVEADATTAEIQEDYPVPTLGPPVDPMAEIVHSVRDRVREDFDQNVSSDSGEGNSSGQQTYDAVGLLKPVVSRRQGAPQYALVDDSGNVISFVTPTPDLNLKPYIGRRVGVNGTRGFINEYRRNHVTAGRITQVDGTIRR